MNTAIKPITPEREQELVAKLVDFLSSRYDAGNLYDILRHGLAIWRRWASSSAITTRRYDHEKGKCHDHIRE